MGKIMAGDDTFLGHPLDEAGKQLLSGGMYLLGNLNSRVGSLESSAKANTELCGKIADDVTEIKLALAKGDGRRQNLISMGRFGEILITLIAAVATAWGTVKMVGVSAAVSAPAIAASASTLPASPPH